MLKHLPLSFPLERTFKSAIALANFMPSWPNIILEVLQYLRNTFSSWSLHFHYPVLAQDIIFHLGHWIQAQLIMRTSEKFLKIDF